MILPTYNQSALKGSKVRNFQVRVAFRWEKTHQEHVKKVKKMKKKKCEREGEMGIENR